MMRFEFPPLMKIRLNCFGSFYPATLAFVGLALAGVGQFRAVADVTLDAKLVPAVTINGPLNSLQRVEYPTNLSDTNAWTVLSHVRLDTASKAFYDPNASGPQRFYRTKM